MSDYRVLVEMEYPIMPKKKSQHDVLREIFAKEGTTLPLNEIAKKLGTTPVSARAAMATLRNPKRQVTPFVITRVPGTQDYGRGPKKKKAMRSRGGANGPVVAAAM